MNKKKELSAQAAKIEFVNSIYTWLQRTLIERGNEQYCDCFKVEGSSIICNFPDNYFDLYTIPTNMKIEMKFVVKKS